MTDRKSTGPRPWVAQTPEERTEQYQRFPIPGQLSLFGSVEQSARVNDWLAELPEGEIHGPATSSTPMTDENL